MNILFIATAYPPAVGGAQIHAHCRARALRAMGHDVRVVSHWSDNRTDWIRGSTFLSSPAREYEWEGVPVHELGYPGFTRFRMADWAATFPLWPTLSTRMLANIMTPFLEAAAGQPELVHATRIGREFIVRAALDLSRRRNIPFVLTPNHHPRWHGWLYRAYDRIYREADALIALTEEEKRLLVEQKGVPEDRIHIHPIGPVLSEKHDAEAFRAAHQLGEHPFVLFLGQQYPYKGPQALLQAAPMLWKDFPDLRFVFIGPPTPWSEALFRDVNDPRILNLGKVDLETKTSALAACSFMCMPSMQESFGGVYVEAWCLGKAVIGGNIPPIACVVDDGINGLLTSQEPEELSRHIRTLLESPETADRMGEAGKQKADACYTWEAIARQSDALYRRLTGA